MSRALRLVWMLVILLLAIPAMQASACAPGPIALTTTSHHSHHERQAPAPSQPRHDCIGCVAPIDIDTYRPIERLSYALDRASFGPRSPRSRSRNAPPEPPPPRSV